MTNVGIGGFPGPTPDARYAPSTAYPNLRSGAYYFASSQGAAGTSSTLGVGTLRVAPCIISTSCYLSAIGADVSSAGEAGSKFRIGIFADNGTGYPGQLVLDAGTIAGDSNTVQEVVVSQPLPAGLYWFGGAVQVVTVTQPTMRVASAWHPPIPMRATSSFAAGGVALGYSMSATGALPATYSTTVSISGSVPRIFFKVA